MTISGCAGNKSYDGQTLVMAIPKDCERQYVEFYKCEFSKTFWDKILFKKCLIEDCED